MTALAVAWFGWVGIPSARADGAVLVGAGDIASCRSSGDAATAALIRSIGGTVFTLGDNAYPDATTKQFNACYGPTWGQVKSRTRPAIGNHEYETKGAAAYWDYFGKAAGPKGKGWYSYNAGAWHVIVLNANCNKVGCRKGSEQERWLRADLAKHDNECTLAYWHQSRFSSGRQHGNEPDVRPVLGGALRLRRRSRPLGPHPHLRTLRPADAVGTGRPRPRDPPVRGRKRGSQSRPARVGPAQQPGPQRRAPSACSSSRSRPAATTGASSPRRARASRTPATAPATAAPRPSAGAARR